MDYASFNVGILTFRAGPTTLVGNPINLHFGILANSFTHSIANDLNLTYMAAEFSTSGVLTCTGNIEGGGLLKTSGGTLNLNGATNLSSTLQIDGGIVSIGQSMNVLNLAGTGTVNLSSGGNLFLNGDDTYGFAGAITGNGVLTKKGVGTITFSGPSTFTGKMYVNSGEVRFGRDNAFGVSQLNVAAGASVDLQGHNANQRAILGSGTIKLSGGGSLSVASGGVFDGVLTGTGGFSLVENTQLFLSRANTYTGGTTIDKGQLAVAYLNGNYALKNSGQLQFFDPNNADGLLSGVVSGQGLLGKYGTNALTVTGANTYTGGTNVLAGTLNANGAGSLGNGPINVSGGAFLNVNANVGATALLGAGSIVINGANQLTLTTASDSISVPALGGTGGLTKKGAGTLLFAGPTTYTGATTIQAGKVKVSADNFRSQSVVVQAGTAFQIDGAASGFMRTSVSGAGDFLKTGTGRLLLDGAIANTGSATISGGAIYAVSPAQMTGMTLATGTRFTNDSQGTIEFLRPVVTQAEFVTTSGSKTVFDRLVSGAGNFSGYGETYFKGGYSPGNSPASVTIQGDMLLGSANDLTIELGGATLGSGYDHLNVLGNAVLAGYLKVAYYNGFSASNGQSFDLFDFTHQAGLFSSITLPTLATGLVWNTTNLYVDGTLSVQPQAVPEPATLAILATGALAMLRGRRKA
jgi:fibronectin-binding autotransporter adhesin